MLLIAAGLIFGLICTIHIVVPYDDIDSITSCVIDKPCIAALASLSPITLKCRKFPKRAKVSWQYLDLSEPYAQPITFIREEGLIRGLKSPKQFQLMLKSTLVAGNLRIKNPTVDDTGVYTCKAGEKTLAYYEIDFQDMGRVHISYADLGEKVQENVSVALGDQSRAQMFTLWSAWQPCDRCGRQGERKRVGFCYAEVIKGAQVVGLLLPCGLQRSKFKQIPLTHGPELRIETCQVNCSEIESLKENTDEVPLFVQDSYLTYYHADAKLTCPRSSVYRATEGTLLTIIVLSLLGSLLQCITPSRGRAPPSPTTFSLQSMTNTMFHITSWRIFLTVS
ncbi:protein FAM187B [Rhinatrema bivittatum]|uniref:protein FAM187B n=1 Tax=Rhinatrema bivittatum TaxID=194408 RepID=UPI0011286C8D|nr:protein FAM187B [Rhinatrema bivittatum]